MANVTKTRQVTINTNDLRSPLFTGAYPEYFKYSHTDPEVFAEDSKYAAVTNDVIAYTRSALEAMGMGDMPEDFSKVTPEQARRLAACIIVDGKPLSESAEYMNINSVEDAKLAAIKMTTLMWHATKVEKSNDAQLDNLDVQLYNPLENEKISIDNSELSEKMKRQAPPVKIPWWKRALHTLFGAFESDFIMQREAEKYRNGIDERQNRVQQLNNSTFEEKPKTLADLMGIDNPVEAEWINKQYQADKALDVSQLHNDYEAIKENIVFELDDWDDANETAEEWEERQYKEQFLAEAEKIRPSMNNEADAGNNGSSNEAEEEFIVDLDAWDMTTDIDELEARQKNAKEKEELILDLDDYEDDMSIEEFEAQQAEKAANNKRMRTSFTEQEEEYRLETGSEAPRFTQQPKQSEISTNIQNTKGK